MAVGGEVDASRRSVAKDREVLAKVETHRGVRSE
jgi:hypothetical protein